MNKKLVIIDGLLLSTQKEPYNFSAYENAESYLNINLVHTRLLMIQKQNFFV